MEKQAIGWFIITTIVFCGLTLYYRRKYLNLKRGK